MYALHLTHPGPSFLLQDPPGAVGSFSAPGGPSEPSVWVTDGQENVLFFACFFPVGGSYWSKPSCEHGKNMQTPHRKGPRTPAQHWRWEASPAQTEMDLLMPCKVRGGVSLLQNTWTASSPSLLYRIAVCILIKKLGGGRRQQPHSSSSICMQDRGT